MKELRLFQDNNELYEKMVSQIINDLPYADVFVDAGAHVGRHTEMMLSRNDVTAVFAVEAIPTLAKLISEKSWVDDRLQIRNCAVGRNEGSTSFYIASNAMGYSGLAQRMEIPGIEWEKIEVEMLTLDQIIPSSFTSSVSLIKLDLEGGEFDAIRGCVNTIKHSKPFLVFENSLREAANQFNYGKEDFFDFFASNDYELFDFFGAVVDGAYWDAVLQTYMFVACPRASSHFSWWIDTRPELIQYVINSN